MKRFLYFLLMIVAVIASSYIVLFSVEFQDGIGWVVVENLLTGLFAGSATLGFNTADFVVYGLIAFCVINIAILFTMVIMFLMNFGMLNRIFKFYSVSGWFLVSSIIFTIAYAFYWYAVAVRIDNIGEGVGGQFPIMVIVPIIASVVMFVMGLLFKKGENKKAA